MEALPVESKDAQRNNQYAAVIVRLHRLLEGIKTLASASVVASTQKEFQHDCAFASGESDLVAAMATVACELHSRYRYSSVELICCQKYMEP